MWWLRLKGYAILDTRFRRPMGEIDIIAQRGQILVFIEVKQRARLETALDAVPERAWQRISAAATAYAGAKPFARDLDWRFDLIAIVPGRWPKHYRDYWRP